MQNLGISMMYQRHEYIVFVCKTQISQQIYSVMSTHIWCTLLIKSSARQAKKNCMTLYNLSSIGVRALKCIPHANYMVKSNIK